MSGSSPQPVYPSSLFKTYTIAFEGSSVACVLFGIYLVVAAINISLLKKKKYRLLLAYTTLQLVLTTVYILVSLYAAPAQSLSIFSIGNSYSVDALSPGPAVVVDVAFVLNTWISDAFLLYRCHVIWMGNKAALAFPIVLYISTLGSSIAWLVVSSEPGAEYDTQSVQLTGRCYWSSSTATNICASVLMAVRLWMHRQTIARAVGPQLGSFYLSYMAMTLESALLYTGFAVVALIVFTVNSPLENVFFPVLGVVQVIAPSLIVNRIARGVAFDAEKRNSARLSTIEFTPNPKLRHDAPPNGSEATPELSEQDRLHSIFCHISEEKETV